MVSPIHITGVISATDTSGPPIPVEILSLTDQINDIGAGTLPPQEAPLRPQLSTPDELDKEYAPHRTIMRERLTSLIKQAAAGVGVCTHLDSVLTITVDKQHHAKLYQKQYHIPNSLMPLLKQIIQRWQQEGRVKLAPPGTQFNTPLLVAPKYDKDGHVSGVRVCFDARRLNKVMNEDDRFPLPHIPDILDKFKVIIFHLLQKHGKNMRCMLVLSWKDYCQLVYV